MTQRNQDQDKVFTGPAGSQGKPAADMVVLVDGSSTPVRLGEALQTAGSDVNQIVAGDHVVLDPAGGTGVVEVSVEGGVDIGDLVELEDVDGNPGLPAVDGSQLTGVVAEAATLDDLANDPDTTTGLTYGYKGGNVQSTNSTGTAQSVNAGTVSIPDDTTSDVYLDRHVGEGEVVVGFINGAPPDAVWMARVTAVSGEITDILDQRTFLNNNARFFQSQIADGGFASVSGLDLTVAGSSTSELLFSNSRTGFSGETITLADDAENFVEIDPDGSLVANTSDFVDGNYPVAIVTTAAGEVTNYVDKRPFASVPAPPGLTDLANDPDTTTGLDYGYKAGNVRDINGQLTVISAGTITLPDNESNNVYVDPVLLSVAFANADDVPFGAFKMAAVTTAAGEVTVVNERRAFANAFGSYTLGQLGNDFAQNVSNTSGLNYGFFGGIARRLDGTIDAVGGNTLALPDDTSDINIYWDPSGGVQFTLEADIPFGTFKMAVVTTAAGEITNVEDDRAFANGFGEYLANEIAVDLKITQGDDPLDVDSHAGLLLASTGLQSVDGQTITLTDDATNYVEISVVTQGDVVSNTTGFTKGAYPLAQVTTAAGIITELLDKRPYLTLPDVAPKVVTTQFDKTNDTTLANVPGLTFDVQAGVTYTFEATLFTVSNVGTGVKAAIGGTCTADSIIYEGTIYAAGISVASGATRTTTKGDPVASLTATTVARIDITGTIKVSEPGTLTVQFAENTAVAATVSSVLINSKFSVHRVG